MDRTNFSNGQLHNNRDSEKKSRKHLVDREAGMGEYGHHSYVRQAGRLTARLIDPDDMGIHIKRRHEEKDKQRILE